MNLATRAGLLLAAAWLAGCASRGPSAPAGGRDGVGSDIPADLARVPDATPRIEPLRVGGPNKPYEVLGVRYEPLTTDAPVRERGGASWYGRKFHGRPTASGEPYDMYAMTAAHKTMPLPSYARVRNPANGREIVVRVNDRGPFHADRVIDLSYTAALKLGVLNGVAPVEVERITHAEIRAGGGAARAVPSAPYDGPGAGPDAGREAVAPGVSPGFWLQLGAFRERDGALQLQRLVQRTLPGLSAALVVVDEPPWVRVQAGPWATRQEAETQAARVADALPLQPVVLRRPTP